MRPVICSLASLFVLIACSGCVVVESKTLVVVIPEDSKKIELCYLFEGISYLDEPGSTLSRAQSQIEDLKSDTFGFFVPCVPKQAEWLDDWKFEETRFFVDPSRKRTLCSDRRMTVLDRDSLAKRVNQALSEREDPSIRRAMRLDDQELRATIAEYRRVLKQPDSVFPNWIKGLEPIYKAFYCICEIIEQFDSDSLKLLREAAKNEEYQWLRFESTRARIVLPATPERAKAIAGDPKTRELLKEMRTFLSPVDVEADKDGLSILVGKKGEFIRFTHSDDRKFSADYDDKLAKYAGAPMPILIDGKPAKAKTVIDQFIKDKTSPR